jgi:hypothetical protein
MDHYITNYFAGRQQKIGRGVKFFKEENPRRGDPVKDRDWVDRHRIGLAVN